MYFGVAWKAPQMRFLYKYVDTCSFGLAVCGRRDFVVTCTS